MPAEGHEPRRRAVAPRVLVVEDEARLRDLLVDVIPEMGFEASAARTAEEAVRAMAADPREVVILDLQLPLMHGMDLFRLVRERWPRTQVIVLTGFGDLEAARAAIRLDVVDFLAKPCHLSDVEVALDRARRRLAPDAKPADLPTELVITTTAPADPPSDRPETLAELEWRQILAALDRNGGNRTRAAAELGISRRTLHYRLKQHLPGES